MFVALTRSVPPTINQCELTHARRQPIDYERAVAQHEAYEAALVSLGCRVLRLTETPDLPDSVFVEDAAVVFDGFAILARPGAESRRAEVETVAAALRPFVSIASIEPPGTLDGGDVLVTPGRVFVGISARTNHEGARQLSALLASRAIEVTPVPITRCLHLKSAVTLAADTVLVVNREWVDPVVFEGFQILDIDRAEPSAANVLRIGDRVLCATEHPRTRARLETAGLLTWSVDAEELAKAEGGLTCCSLIVRR